MKTFCKIDPDLLNKTFVSPLTKIQKSYLYDLVAMNLDRFNYRVIDEPTEITLTIENIGDIKFKFFYFRRDMYPVQVHDTIIILRIGVDYISLLANKCQLPTFVRKFKLKNILND